ncbi:hypothetical protein MASR1M90_11170 [Desulfovibrionales bacterium]
MNITIRGTRGSIPVASSETQRYGGNTTCIEITTVAGEHIILDAGSGIRALGDELMSHGSRELTICFTHAHWDHLLGFTMFAPIFSSGSSICIHAPQNIGRDGIRTVLGGIMDKRYFPVTLDNVPARLTIHDFQPGEAFQIGSALIETCPTWHPGGNVAYKITADGWTFFFSGDHEWSADAEAAPICQNLQKFLAGVDVALVDAQYTDEEYLARQGWGHSTYSAWPQVAANAGIGHLLFSHHDPARTDADLDMICAKLRMRFHPLPVVLDMAAEGMVITVTDHNIRITHTVLPHMHKDEIQGESGFSLLAWINAYAQELTRYNDVGVLLDRILLEGRTITQADAGTIFFVEENYLTFAFIHNDTLFPGSAANKFAYANTKLPLDNTSIAGFVALSRQAVNIQDMRHLPSSAPFSFNEALDLATGYRTVSTLTVPILGRNNIVLGVMQLINSMPDGVPEPFTDSMEARVQLLATHAGSAIERGIMAQELVLRMLEMAAMRDPHETGPHVQRVGAYAAEIYHKWAERHGIDIDELRYTKSQIRLAAMLHDVGKVGISDLILKKPGRLDAEEFAIMQTHCVLGAHIFKSGTSELDRMGREIALHHHQKWNGTGYTGTDDPPLAGKDIPLTARITALADVYDALCSRRCYKEAWECTEAVEIIKNDADTHFDPEIVDCFLDVLETIEAIRAKYPDTENIC